MRAMWFLVNASRRVRVSVVLGVCLCVLVRSGCSHSLPRNNGHVASTWRGIMLLDVPLLCCYTTVSVHTHTSTVAIHACTRACGRRLPVPNALMFSWHLCMYGVVADSSFVSFCTSPPGLSVAVASSSHCHVSFIEQA